MSENNTYLKVKPTFSLTKYLPSMLFFVTLKTHDVTLETQLILFEILIIHKNMYFRKHIIENDSKFFIFDKSTKNISLHLE